jgi:LDH2 family malate/lactate/ureidoglycolate dehydrogenase
MRPRRSVLFMPGSNARALEKARTLPADALVLDLEDAVAPDMKVEARAQVMAAVRAGGYGRREIVVRVNALGTPWGRTRPDRRRDPPMCQGSAVHWLAEQMPTDTTERVHLSVAEARALSERAMRGIGYEPEDARILADHVLDAALCGYEYSGLPKLLNVADHPRFKAPRSPLRVVRETGVSALLDGGNQNGMLGMYHTTRTAIERAKPHGLALVGVNNIWMSGRSAYYVEMVARAGLIGIHTVAAPPLVAPLGGARAALGTNPIAFGFPMEGDPLVIDLGTSAFMGTDLQFRQRLGLPLPEGVAIDEHGHPTTDAAAARRGALLPFGGHKGYALALAMHALGVLCGGAASPERDGYLFIAFKPDLFMPLDDYRRVLAAEIAAIKATPRQEGVEEIRIPGERAYRERARLAREGIEIDRRIQDALIRLAEGRGGRDREWKD